MLWCPRRSSSATASRWWKSHFSGSRGRSSTGRGSSRCAPDGSTRSATDCGRYRPMTSTSPILTLPVTFMRRYPHTRSLRPRRFVRALCPLARGADGRRRGYRRDEHRASRGAHQETVPPSRSPPLLDPRRSPRRHRLRSAALHLSRSRHQQQCLRRRAAAADRPRGRLLLGAGSVIIVQAPWWSGTPRLRIQPAGAAPLLRQIGTAVNVLLMLGSHDTRSAPFVLHTLKGGLLIVASIAGLLA